MEWLFIIGLGAAVFGLAGRLRAAERRIAEVEAEQAGLWNQVRAGPASRAEPGEPVAAPEPEPVAAEPVRLRVSVPKSAPAPAIAEDAAVFDPIAADLTAPHEADADARLEPELASASPRFDLEDIFGRRLPIWAGGVTLAVAGVFLVRYSIERGLITPALRVALAFLFGFGLLAAAEAAYRWRERVADPRVGQALAGAGLATLYAAFYLAGTQYGLIGQSLAFLGLAAVTAGAIALSFRFGLPSAVLGLVGGFAAPVLVGGDDANLPLLSLYLGLVTAGLVLSGRRQQRPWMGLAALGGGLGWGALLLLSGDFGTGETIALGLYFIVLGAVLPALSGASGFERPLRLAGALVASVQIAVLVDQAGYAPLVWAFYCLLGATLAFLGWRRPDLREASGIAAVVAVVLLAQWHDPSGPLFAAVTGALAVIFGAVPLELVRRAEDRPSDRWQIAGVAMGLAAVSFGAFGGFEHDRIDPVLASAALALALLPAGAAWLIRRRDDSAAYAVQLAAAAALVFAALLMVTPVWTAPLAAAAVFGGAYAIVAGRGEKPLHALVWGIALVTALALAAHAPFLDEVAHLGGSSQDSRAVTALLRWLALAAVLGAMAWRERDASVRPWAEGAAMLALYGALAQILPGDALAWTAALLAIGTHLALRERTGAALAAGAIALVWALEPLGWWLGAGLASLSADPVLVTDLPGLDMVTMQLLPAAAALAVLRVPVPERLAGRLHWASLAIPLAVVAAHILFKQLFAIDSAARFTLLGLAERTVWEAVLLAAAWIAAHGAGRLAPNRPLALAIGAAALAHFALYTGLLHNPLWAAQALGPMPFANLALAAYATGIATAVSLRRWAPVRLAPGLDGVVMALACLAVLTLLRQAFAGSLPAAVPLSQTEDLLRSLAGIVLALGFLWLGSRLGERSWRVGSLAIILIAVVKVFLVDAAGLDGLLRVASFMALGFSLIGIGWVYSRQLRSRPVPE